MKPLKIARKLEDRRNKIASKLIPTGGPGRMMEEAMNTSANAKGYAQLVTKKPKVKRFS